MKESTNLPVVREYSAGVVLFTEKNGQRKYLILHYPGGHFDFPKGHLEQGETERDAALRELREETGIEVPDFIPGFQQKMFYSFRRHDHRVDKTVTFYLAGTATSSVIISHEHRGYLWLEFQQALQQITFENARQILRRAEELLTNKRNQT